MVESVQVAPQFALSIGVDMTRAMELRSAVKAEAGERVSVTGILVRFVADALQGHPRVNASFVDCRLKIHKHINIGVAVGTDEGLVVPVIRDADRKSLVEICREVRLLQEKAVNKRIGLNDLTGGTFTISNLGMHGVDSFQAILNPPESAILAAGRIIKTPMGMPDDTIALRPIMCLTLTVDHRTMDGIAGAKFLADLKQRLEQPCLKSERV
jgi:pyruvate dehydrogenase E2 component (dihydrolipoamide acetyltransferase)